MNSGAMVVPINFTASGAGLRFVVVVKKALELILGVAGGLICSSGSKSLQPVCSKVLTYEICRISLMKLTYSL